MTLYFMQLADPQFGMFAALSGKSEEEAAEYRARGLKVRPLPKITGLQPERELFGEAIKEANRLRPAFVVVCGDMVHQWDDPEQLDAVKEIASRLSPDIPIYWVPGNHDACCDGAQAVTHDTLSAYRSNFGADYYAFQHGGTSFIVANSAVMYAPEGVEDEWSAQLSFLETELQAAARRDAGRIIVFTHHPLFVHHPEENVPEESGVVVPLAQRRPVMDLLRRHGVSAVFAGHWHRNNYSCDDVTGMQMISSGAVGYPLGDDPSGYRIVRVSPGGLSHRYFEFGDGPERLEAV
ncbi:MAG: metallophosphoesterase [Chloroflexota bacterium]